MKQIDWKRWCAHVFQTCLWVGTSVPGQGSQARFAVHGGGMKPTVQFGSALSFRPVWIAIGCRFYFGAGIFWFHSRASCKGKASVRESEAARLGKGEADAAAAFTSAFTAPYVADESKGHRSHGKGSDGTAAAFTAAFMATVCRGRVKRST